MCTPGAPAALAVLHNTPAIKALPLWNAQFAADATKAVLMCRGACYSTKQNLDHDNNRLSLSIRKLTYRAVPAWRNRISTEHCPDINGAASRSWTPPEQWD